MIITIIITIIAIIITSWMVGKPNTVFGSMCEYIPSTAIYRAKLKSMTHVASNNVVFIDPAVINICTIYSNIVCTAPVTSQPASQPNKFVCIFVWKQYFIDIFRSFLFHLARRILFIRIRGAVPRRTHWNATTKTWPGGTDHYNFNCPCECCVVYLFPIWLVYIFSDPNWNRNKRQTGRACKKVIKRNVISCPIWTMSNFIIIIIATINRNWTLNGRRHDPMLIASFSLLWFFI